MNVKSDFTEDHDENMRIVTAGLGSGKSFDLVERHFKICKKSAVVYFVDGLTKGETINKLISALLNTDGAEMKKKKDAAEFTESFIAYGETRTACSAEPFIRSVLSGVTGLLIEGYPEGILIDARSYSARSANEPENDRVLRGPHEGFVETLIFNTAMIRRRIRDAALTMELIQVGERSKTDVVICYMAGRADGESVNRIREKIKAVKINTLSMGHESLLECLVEKQRFNPFPKVRYTERPDAASASIAEGQILILVDNSPAAMIIPGGIFDFMQDTNDYYFPTAIGTYLRVIRVVISTLTLLLSPVWYLLIVNETQLPKWLDFVRIKDPINLPVIIQLLIIELVIGALKMSSLNTPTSLGNSFSVVAALLLGELAVTAEIFVSEAVLFMAFVAIANFAQPSFELSYALKLSRIMLLILTAAFNLYGFIAGILIILLTIATTKTVSGKNYLYPLIPFNKKALANLILRKPISNERC
ncbi:MAG: spore germination protein [Clostridiales bacterium]|nr:spore germination protein [Clostridiales bacterium]